MKTFREWLSEKELNEAKGDWEVESRWKTDIVRYDGSKSMNVVYDDGEWRGYGTKNDGDVDSRGFDSESSLSRAGSAFTRAFKLDFGSLVAEYILCAAKELSKTKKVTANLTNKYMQDEDNFDVMRNYIDKYKQ